MLSAEAVKATAIANIIISISTYKILEKSFDKLSTTLSLKESMRISRYSLAESVRFSKFPIGPRSSLLCFICISFKTKIDYLS